MKFGEKCVYLGLNSFHSKKTDKDYNLLRLHLPCGDIHEFFVENDLAAKLDFDLYTQVEVEFEVKFFKGNAQIAVNKVSKWIQK